MHPSSEETEMIAYLNCHHLSDQVSLPVSRPYKQHEVATSFPHVGDILGMVRISLYCGIQIIVLVVISPIHSSTISKRSLQSTPRPALHVSLVFRALQLLRFCAVLSSDEKDYDYVATKNSLSLSCGGSAPV